MYRTLAEAVLAHAREQGDKPAVLFRKTAMTYREMAEEVRRCAALLASKYGVEAGDRIMITGLSSPEYLVMFLGIQYLHATTVPLDKVWMEDTVLRLYDMIRPKLVLCDRELHREGIPAVRLRECYREALEGTYAAPEYTLPEADRIAEMLFTTGTTGTPKGAMLTYGNIRSITENNIEGVGFRPDDVVLDALPLCHSLGLREARMTLYAGATLVLQNGFSFPKETRSNMAAFHCTGFVCVPAIMEQLTRTMEDFSAVFGGLRYMEIGAGSLSYDLKRRLPALLPGTEIRNTWGSSETGGVIFLDVGGRQDKITALGKPVPAAEVRAADAEGRTIRATDIDHAGRLAVRGEMTMAGYYNLPEVNAETLADGWLLTNDLVYMDDEGFVYMLGRADDIMNIGGEKVSPIEIENVATEFPAVTDAACIGAADEILGQAPVLFVAAQEPYREEELAQFLREKMEPVKQPRQIIRVEEIPRNRMKKLDRKAVRKMFDSLSAGPAAEPGLVEAIMSRRSVRLFTEKRIDRGLLETLVKAGAQAPSGHNLQPWRFTVVTNPDTIVRIRETGQEVAEREKTGFHGFNNPAALILVTYSGRDDCGLQDAACASENILLAAHASGLGGCWLNGLTRIQDQPEIREMLSGLGVPEDHRVCSLVALGYAAGSAPAAGRRENTVFWVE